MAKRVVVGLSGGVDSSVAAYLLKEQGYEVIGLFMINWHDKTGVIDADCPWDEDVLFAELVAKQIGIPFHVVDLSVPYKKRVIDYMFSEYEKGRTPNPDVLCNREIKFDEFFRAASQFSPDFVATGHYCKKDTRVINGRTVYRLLEGDDPNKEQSYFLCQLSQAQLEKSLFPIGHLQKSEVRQIAREHKLASAGKKDSQGICFVGKVHLPVFLQQKLKAREGNIFEIPADYRGYALKKVSSDLKELCSPYTYTKEDGLWVGKHQGAHFFTIGQRKGLNVGGKAEPLFVIATDVNNNRVFTGMGQNHPGLFRKGLKVNPGEIHWIRDDLKMEPGEERRYMVRIRYRQSLQEATLLLREDGLYILFRKPQRGIAPGQFAAWYQDGELLGSGVIYE
ncbi:MAG: tRNA 2-thiouridine(34) synthase MnmA [Bacteroidales bacterium]|nr:tRNA 2-thiouridine(34) synthase MnmA [Bacteroidales bacterium]MBN2697896.1 tRNA 2-thiouridine(34) synthase MnmA [Bacteroidales bacterium]